MLIKHGARILPVWSTWFLSADSFWVYMHKEVIIKAQPHLANSLSLSLQLLMTFALLHSTLSLPSVLKDWLFPSWNPFYLPQWRVCISVALYSALTHLDHYNLYVKMLFIDLGAAFNTIIPSRLISKLGISTLLRNWTPDFLTNKAQFVKLDIMSVTTITLNICVPQGCVLFLSMAV